MKVQKLICIDQEVAENLKQESNASKLVNDLLLNFYHGGRYQEIEEIEQNITKLSAEKQEISNKITHFQKKLKEIKEKVAETKALFREIPQDLLEDFNKYPQMTPIIFMNRWKDIYKSQFPSLNYDKAKEAFDHHYKNGSSTINT